MEETDLLYADRIGEKLRREIEEKGIVVFDNIDKLVRMSKNNGSRVVITECIEDKTDMLTRWETDTRYDIDYCVEKDKVQIGLVEIKKFLDMNGLKAKLRDELKDTDVKMKLESVFPKDFVPADDFEWNCFYQIFSKKLASI